MWYNETSGKGETPWTEKRSCCVGFDQLMLGYQKTESLFLPPEHLRGIFSLSGMVMPALLLRGRVAGRWKRTGKKLLITAFEAISREDREQIAEKAEELWSGVKLEFP